MSENPLHGRRRSSITGSGSLNSSLDEWINQSRDAAGLDRFGGFERFWLTLTYETSSFDKAEEIQRVQKEEDARVIHF